MGRLNTSDCSRGGSGLSEGSSRRRLGGRAGFDADLVPDIDAALIDPRKGFQEELMIFRRQGLADFASRVLSLLKRHAAQCSLGVRETMKAWSG